MDSEQKGIVYLIQPAELVGTNRYKVGQSGKTNLSRLKSYKKGSRYLYEAECYFPEELESKILEAFSEKFNLFTGKEYFEGNEDEMFNEISNIVMKYERGKALGVIDDDSFEVSVSKKLGLEDCQSIVVYDRSRLETPFQCEKCKDYFKRQENLDYHVKNKTCDDKNHYCKHCGKGFTTKNSMYRHMKHSCKVKKIIDDALDERLKKLCNQKTIPKPASKTVTKSASKSKGGRTGKHRKVIKTRKDND